MVIFIFEKKKAKISKCVLGTWIGKNFEISPCVVMCTWKTNLIHGSSSNLREVHPLKFIEGYGAVFHKTMTGPATRFSIPHNADPCHPLSSHIATNLYFLSPSRSPLLCSHSLVVSSHAVFQLEVSETTHEIGAYLLLQSWIWIVCYKFITY